MTQHHPPMDLPPAPPTRHHSTMVALVGVAIVVALADAVISISVGGLDGDDLLAVLGVLGFTSIGALVLDRRPGEPVGRICLAIGLLFSLGATVRLAAILIDAQPGPLPDPVVVMAIVASTLVNMAILLGGPMLITRFPRRSADRRQRRAEDLWLSITAVAVVLSTTQQARIEYQWIDEMPNPLHLQGFPIGDGDLFTIALMVYALTYLVATVGLVGRYRSGGAVVRAQIRWFGASVGLSLVFLGLIALDSIWRPIGDYAWSLWIVSLLLPPIGLAIAILRYRLFDIDRIISNAIGYGLVTFVLFIVFAVVNLTLVSQVSPLVNNEGIAVAASTLLVAALFTPLRTRVQWSVDRRFHRTRYDGDRMVQAFAGRLRDELDLATLATDLVETTAGAVAPTSAALWLRGSGS